MDNAMLICYGTSEENLKTTLKTNIIGFKRNLDVQTNQTIFLVIKRDGIWNVVGKSKVLSRTDTDPFNSEVSYYTYKVAPIEKCIPFEISQICRQELGTSYGLVLIRPQVIRVKAFLDYLQQHFVASK